MKAGETGLVGPLVLLPDDDEMLIHVKEDLEETLRVIFQPSFPRLGAQGASYSYIHMYPKKGVVQGPKLLCFAILEL